MRTRPPVAPFHAMDTSIYVTFRYPDDPEQKFAHARFPAMPRVGDFVSTPPPLEREYTVAAVGFECEGSHIDETIIVVVLHRGATPAAPA